MKNVLLFATLFTSLFALPRENPIEPWEMHAQLGRGFDVSWVEFTQNIEAYSSLQVKAMKEKGFNTARIRTKLPADSTLFALLDQVILDCYENEIIPIIAYNAAEYEANPTEENREKDFLWWQTVAEHYQDYTYNLLFNLNIEWSDIGGKDSDGVNLWYETITPAIRASNPYRIILYSPIKLSNPTYLSDMVIPQSAGDYVMAEFHSYAAGPNPDSLSDNGRPNPKFWTTGTEYQKKLVREMVSTGRNWQDSTNIPTWLGAWMAGNTNHGNTFSAAEQKIFAEYFVKVLDSLEIPWAINTLDMYYDIEQNCWIDSMAPVLAVLSPQETAIEIDRKNAVAHSTPFTVRNGVVHLRDAEQYRSISLFTLSGKKVVTQATFGQKSVLINCENISSGGYIISLDGAVPFTQKLVIQ